MPYWLASILPALLLGYLVWFFLMRKKEPKIKQFIEAWKKILQDNVDFYAELDAENKSKFEAEVLYFLNEVTITGVDVQIDDTDCLLVASSAVIPLFGFPELRYRNINEVLLYKDSFNEDHQTEGSGRTILGKVGSGDMNRLMILSLPALRAGFALKESESNVGIHEFVHLIDKADGAVDGIPESIMKKQFILPWLNIMHQEIEKINEKDSDINPYGATSQIEFLSVVSEYFFNQPEKLKEKHPELYSLLSKIYAQDRA
ncbi:zinc-dependent peptidase [Cellulophaga sp. HaHaR_3_176]|uniref:M90 family metallopeptidase n=1 Tax=Cellulophaga sp. HaHaR_3_176 TaxID=1942464 RepID=UPI001C1FE823|nr:M90 family metallopeptidase [Cellulophaga sp. HaHaR_3_176]QWX83547.1 zinc-dependent peptidase [Cellulophaga sp. HaHaR_3_176]